MHGGVQWVRGGGEEKSAPWGVQDMHGVKRVMHAGERREEHSRNGWGDEPGEGWLKRVRVG